MVMVAMGDYMKGPLYEIGQTGGVVIGPSTDVVQQLNST